MLSSESTRPNTYLNPLVEPNVQIFEIISQFSDFIVSLSRIMGIKTLNELMDLMQNINLNIIKSNKILILIGQVII